MNEDFTYLNDRLKHVYDKIRREVGFSLSLPSLIANRELWKTDITGSLERAIVHLLRADSGELSDTEQLEEIENADLVIRDLLAQLLTENEFRLENPRCEMCYRARWYFKRARGSSRWFS